MEMEDVVMEEPITDTNCAVAVRSGDFDACSSTALNNVPGIERIQKGDNVVVLFNDEDGGCVIRAEGDQKLGKTRSETFTDVC